VVWCGVVWWKRSAILLMSAALQKARKGQRTFDSQFYDVGRFDYVVVLIK